MPDFTDIKDINPHYINKEQQQQMCYYDFPLCRLRVTNLQASGQASN